MYKICYFFNRYNIDEGVDLRYNRTIFLKICFSHNVYIKQNPILMHMQYIIIPQMWTISYWEIINAWAMHWDVVLNHAEYIASLSISMTVIADITSDLFNIYHFSFRRVEVWKARCISEWYYSQNVTYSVMLLREWRWQNNDYIS